ncbi:hypothetical protein ABPG74_006245 [Tetrahymena malaccensis]
MYWLLQKQKYLKLGLYLFEIFKNAVLQQQKCLMILQINYQNLQNTNQITNQKKQIVHKQTNNPIKKLKILLYFIFNKLNLKQKGKKNQIYQNQKYKQISFVFNI